MTGVQTCALPISGEDDDEEETQPEQWENRPGPSFVAQPYPRGYGPPTPLPTDPWNRPFPAVNGGSMSPYSIPLRDSQLHQQSSFPPSNFQHHPSPLGYQHPRPHLVASYGSTIPFMTSQLPAFQQSQAALGSQSGNSSPRPQPPRPSSVPPWDGGRPSSSTTDATTGNDFLDLIAKSASGEMDLDWDLLNSGYNHRLGEGGTGFTPREGNSPRAADLDDLSHPPDLSAAGPALHVEETSPQTFYSALNAAPSQVEDALTVQDSAAESLLRLASHTPRESPEPEYSPSFAGDSEDKPRSSHHSHSPSDPWPLSYRPSPGREVILPSGRSRAQTPMKEFNDVPASVPRLTEDTRERILAHVREIATAHFDHSERFIPQLELLDLFLQLFFARYQTLLPIIHTCVACHRFSRRN